MVIDDTPAIAVDFDSVAELWEWLRLTGQDTPDLLTGESTYTSDQDGRTYRAVTAYPTWHGWKIYAHAQDPIGPPAIDQQSLAALSVIARPAAA
jgi:hypothetical protein